MNPPRTAFTAALIAGGKSTRMGYDKAAILIDGVPLWERQLAKLRAMSPAECLISGPIDGPWSESDVEVVPDATPGLGPLGGLAAVLERMKHGRLLVLAVDLPAMTTGFLAGLLAQCREGRGLVPVVDAHFEPLAAVYPRAMAGAANSALAGSDLSLQRLVRAGVEEGLLDTVDVPEGERAIFRNLNTPAELAALGDRVPPP